MQELTYDEWFEKYKPIKNNLRQDSHLFETYGEEHSIVEDNIDANKVWTWVDGEGVSQILNGYHYVNRLNYYITEIPWEEDEDYFILVSTETECQCYAEENYDKYGLDGEPECSLCEGYGYVTEYV
jgi:hypothetical protein